MIVHTLMINRKKNNDYIKIDRNLNDNNINDNDCDNDIR